MAIASTKKQNRVLTGTLLVLLSAIAVLLIFTGQAEKKETATETESKSTETLREDALLQPSGNAVEKNAAQGTDSGEKKNGKTTETTEEKEKTEMKNDSVKTNAIEEETLATSANIDMLPTFVSPVDGAVVKDYAMEVPVFSDTMQDWRVHDGVDLAAATGDAVYAAADGKIGKIWKDPMMGTSVTVIHDGGAVSLYQGLSEEFPVTLTSGDIVTAGQVIGAAGDTALIECAEPSHVHYSLQINGVSVNPGDYMALSYLSTEYEDE